ncbi:hypothetical protein BD408DRAFT_426682 [Parasitella parasitica]|nr:hypothetical protein BD408DRAFT_426682 [Parasitella parasitica]
MFYIYSMLVRPERILLEKSLKIIFNGNCRRKYSVDKIRLLLYMTLVQGVPAARASRLSGINSSTGSSF